MTKNSKPADKWFLFAVLSLMFMSLVVVYSASAFWSELKFQNPAYLLRSHLFKVFIGMILIFMVAKFDYHKFEKYAFHLLVISGILLVVALGQRVIIKGAARWIHLGMFSFEPSEVARLAILFFIAAYLAVSAECVRRLQEHWSNLLQRTAIIAGLIVLQPNFSTALMIFAVVGVMLLAGGVKKSHLAVLVAGALVIGACAMVLESYRVARVQSWMKHGSGNYQVQQSIIGFGNGGIFGVGPGQQQAEKSIPAGILRRFYLLDHRGRIRFMGIGFSDAVVSFYGISWYGDCQNMHLTGSDLCLRPG